MFWVRGGDDEDVMRGVRALTVKATAGGRLVAVCARGVRIGDKEMLEKVSMITICEAAFNAPPRCFRSH